MSDTCIYPGPHDVISDEHYLPISLGKFEGCEPLRRRICRTCNARLGSLLETQFARAGPTGLFRWMLGIKGRDGLPPSPFHKGAGGAPPILGLARLPDAPYDLLCELEPGTGDASPLRQIVFEDPVGGPHQVPIWSWMRDHPELLLEHLRERGLEAAKPRYIVAGEDEIPWMEELLRAVGAEGPKNWKYPDAQSQRLPLTATVRVTSAYFRAVAKVTFHYTLAMFPDLTGMEPHFAAIKEFIWAGGDVERFVRQRSQGFVENFRRGYRPTHWMHMLAVNRTPNEIVAHAQFFAGPFLLPPSYEVSIGRNPSRIISRAEWRAHQFVILDPGASPGPIGKMVDAQPAGQIWQFTPA